MLENEDKTRLGMTEFAVTERFTGLTGTDVNLNLLQGSIFNSADAGHHIKPFPTARNEGSTPLSVSDVREGHANYERNSPAITTHNAATNSVYVGVKSQKVLDLEKRLNELTSLYTSQYRIYTDDLMTRNQFLQSKSEYLNKFVRDPSGTDVSGVGTYYYINRHGYTHKYDVSNVQFNDASSCPVIPQTGNPLVINEASVPVLRGGISQFTGYNGPNMVAGQPCLAGVNIQKKDTQEFAWVDTAGVKHVYQAGIWPDKRDETCKTQNVGEPIVLPANKYDAIPTDTANPMTASSMCYKMNVDAAANQRLIDLNREIAKVTAEISAENQNVANQAAMQAGTKGEQARHEDDNDSHNDILKTFKKLYNVPIFRSLFWGIVILIGIIIVFRLLFDSGSSGSSATDEYGNPINNGGRTSLFGIAIASLLFIFVVYYLSRLNLSSTVQIQTVTQ